MRTASGSKGTSAKTVGDQICEVKRPGPHSKFKKVRFSRGGDVAIRTKKEKAKGAVREKGPKSRQPQAPPAWGYRVVPSLRA